jgi:hypothetical protein
VFGSSSRVPVARWRRGQLVEVRSLTEILATLDAEDRFEGLPFMLEMARHCGQRFRIYRRADKVCLDGQSLRRLRNSVLLEGIRCDGASHDGCQRGCLILWKTAWLRAVPASEAEGPGTAAAAETPGTRLVPQRNGRYYCQATELVGATAPMSRVDVWCLWQDFWNGEATLLRVLRVIWCTLRRKLPRRLGRRPAGHTKISPQGELGLNPGDWVEVKSRREIEATLTTDGKNRGLSFETEMLEHCGRRYRVAFPLRKIISQDSGTMIQLHGTVVLDGVTCQGTCARNCPRSNHHYWREVWLRRAAAGTESARPCE